jgi:hypothetical protein
MQEVTKPRKVLGAKTLCTIFEFIGQFVFQNDVHKLKEAFSELEITLFPENGLRSFQAFQILQI